MPLKSYEAQDSPHNKALSSPKSAAPRFTAFCCLVKKHLRSGVREKGREGQRGEKRNPY